MQNSQGVVLDAEEVLASNIKEEALAPTKSGKPAIIKYKPEESELIRRLHLTDPEERMPYKHDPLSKEEIKISYPQNTK